MEEKNKIKEFFSQNVFFMLVILAAVVYVARCIVRIDGTGKTVLEILADGGLALIMGFLIGKLLAMQGFMKGESHPEYLKALSKHEDVVMKCNAKIDNLDRFCATKTEEARREIQTRILSDVGLIHAEFVAGKYDGRFKGKDKDEKEKAKAIRKARRVKITPLTVRTLTGGSKARRKDPYDFAKTKEEKAKSDDRRAVVSKFLWAVIFGYFGVSMVTDFSWAEIIWTAIQTVVFVLNGMWRFAKSYDYIKDDVTASINEKSSYLEMFWLWVNSPAAQENKNQGDEK